MTEELENTQYEWMFVTLRHDAIGFLLLSFVVLPGCSQHTGDTAMPSNDAAKLIAPMFSLNTPVDKIAADRRGKAVLQRDVPGLLSNGSYPLINDMSLSQIASLSSGRLTNIQLDRLEVDLTQLSQPTPQ